MVVAVAEQWCQHNSTYSNISSSGIYDPNLHNSDMSTLSQRVHAYTNFQRSSALHTYISELLQCLVHEPLPPVGVRLQHNRAQQCQPLSQRP
jgi:hypothetical protein